MDIVTPLDVNKTVATPQGPFYEQVGQRIEQARRKRPGLTQAKLAKAAGLSRTSIVNIEKGRQPVYLHHLVIIADLLEVQPAALLPQADPTSIGLEQELKRIVDDAARSFAEKVLNPQREIPNDT